MSLSLPANAFEPGHGLLPRPRFARPGGERAIGVAITLAAHLLVAGALVYGIAVAHAPKAPMPIIVDIVKDTKKPEEKPVVLLKFVAPVQVTVPPPVIEIVPPPPANAITATPPRPPVPVQLAAPPAPVPTPAWNGQAGYYAGLLSYLERFKQYPAAARAAHIEGAVMVHFVMRRDGSVLTAEIYKSSGRPVLDREALAMIARAGRLPPMPAEMPGETLDGILGPITFTLH